MNERVIALEAEITALRGAIEIYRSSTSWRLTAPLRALGRLLKPRRPAPSAPPMEHAPVTASAATAEEAGFSDDQIASGKHWDQVSANPGMFLPRTAWWNDPPTLRHINRVVCGEPIEGAHAGFNRRLAEYLGVRGITGARALSVGSGSGGKELLVLQAGIVGSFDCYEVGVGAVKTGRQYAAESGLSDRLRFHHADAFAVDVARDYDVVYWNNALHHMPDTRVAIAWSRDHLREGGVFAMDDYVGATRYQYSSEIVAWADRVLALLPERFLRRADDPTRLIPRQIHVPDPAVIAAIDPTEAVDSHHILPGVRGNFTDPLIIPTGGAMYLLALNDAFHNFADEADLRLLEVLLLLDEAVAQQGESPYAVAFATKF